MATNYKQEGENLSYVNGTGVTILSGAPVFDGKIRGIALKDILDTETGIIKTCGVFELPKTTPLEINQGDAVYWNTGTKKITKTITDLFFGACVKHEASGSTTVEVLIMQDPGAANIPVAALVAALVDSSGAAAANGTIEAITLTTPADFAAQTVINGQLAAGLKELATKLNAVITALKDAGLMASA